MINGHLIAALKTYILLFTSAEPKYNKCFHLLNDSLRFISQLSE